MQIEKCDNVYVHSGGMNTSESVDDQNSPSCEEIVIVCDKPLLQCIENHSQDQTRFLSIYEITDEAEVVENNERLNDKYPFQCTENHSMKQNSRTIFSESSDDPRSLMYTRALCTFQSLIQISPEGDYATSSKDNLMYTENQSLIQISLLREYVTSSGSIYVLCCISYTKNHSLYQTSSESSDAICRISCTKIHPLYQTSSESSDDEHVSRSTLLKMIFGLVFYLLDVGSDYFMAFRYALSHEYVYCISTMACILIPSAYVTHWIGAKQKSNGKIITLLDWLFSIKVIKLYCKYFRHYYQYIQKGKNVLDYFICSEMYADIKRSKYDLGFLEDIPQIILQLYTIFNDFESQQHGIHLFNVTYQLITISTSLIGLHVNIYSSKVSPLANIKSQICANLRCFYEDFLPLVAYQLINLSISLTGLHVTIYSWKVSFLTNIKSQICANLCFFCEDFLPLAARIAVLAACAATAGPLQVLVASGAHWTLMLIWITVYCGKNDFSVQKLQKNFIAIFYPVLNYKRKLIISNTFLLFFENMGFLTVCLYYEEHLMYKIKVSIGIVFLLVNLVGYLMRIRNS